MILKRLLVWGIVYLFFTAFSSSTPGDAFAQRDSLTLHQPQNLSLRVEMNPIARTFKVFMTFDGIPNTDSTGTFVHQPMLTQWSDTIPEHLISKPSSSGPYTGTIDRTIVFRALDYGEVGITDTLEIYYYDKAEPLWDNTMDVGSSYVPDSWKDAILVSSRSGDTLDLGLRMSFSDGFVEEGGRFLVGCEDFEGFHIWKGVESDGSDLVSIGELSKEEAIRGSFAEGSVVDSLYFNEILPVLRDSIIYYFDFIVPCLGRSIDLKLKDDQFFWFDCNVFNGFTYYYLVTTFDRGYNVSSGDQGLRKVESCLPVLGEPYPCPDDLKALQISVEPQDELLKVYAVPNPYRSGGSAFTTPNYDNYPPEGKVVFANVPDNCTLRIYTVSGDLIWETEHNNLTSGNIEWDTRNESGEEVASGIYIYKVESTRGDHVYGRLIIIR